MKTQSILNSIDSKVRPSIQEIRKSQLADGSVSNDSLATLSQIESLKLTVDDIFSALDLHEFSTYVTNDFKKWLDNSSNSPDFSLTRDNYKLPRFDGDLSFFVAPMVCHNGPRPYGKYLEFFLAERDTPKTTSEIANYYNYTALAEGRVCFSTILKGSKGFREANSIAFFPEAVSASTDFEKQPYAHFFPNKFWGILEKITNPVISEYFSLVDSLDDNESTWRLLNISEEDHYEVRCCQLLLHEMFHQEGPRPLNDNFHVKSRYYCALLEDLKVNLQAALLAYNDKIQNWVGIVEVILFDAVIRYPLEDNAEKNVDAGKGMFLFEWLRSDAAIRYDSGKFEVSMKTTMESIQKLVDKILTLENIADDSEYYESCKNLVFDFLDKPKKEKSKFSIPQRYKNEVSWKAFAPIIHESL